jgi:hypothetical protein
LVFDPCRHDADLTAGPTEVQAAPGRR